jgi:hypothetical protein
LGKHSLFVGPFGTWLRSIGGIPVNRKSKTGLVEQVVAAFAREPRFLLALSPEGTRSRVDQLKTGFLAIAKGAGVPIIQIGLDAERKQISVSAPWWPSGDDAQDLHRATQFFAALNGYRPAQGLGHLRTTGEEPVLFEQFHRNADRHPGRVFLDEPTANLDPESKHRAQQIIQRMMQKKTVICITHDPEMMTIFPRVYQLTEGVLVEKK